MARFIGLSQNISERSEQKVADALSTLDDNWTILHSISWQSIRNGREGDGEADFALVHPRYGIIIVEVKGGGISTSLGKWTSRNRYGVVNDIKNPYQQATDSKHALLEWLRSRLGEFKPSILHAVCFPDMSDLPALGPAANPEITWSRDDLKNIGAAVGRTIRHWEMRAAISPDFLEKIVDALAPTVTVSVRLSTRSADAEERILQLTAEQIAALAGIRASRGGLVVGPAGSGKTLLAVARAQQLIADGFRTLLLCYNELLGSQLEARLAVSNGSRAGTFHALCLSEAVRAKLPMPTNPDQCWWETEAPLLLMEAAAANSLEFDAVVVDEAQDFAPSWLEALRCVLKPGATSPFYAFADPNQELWGRDWRSGSEWDFVFGLTRNLRNTRPISERALNALQMEPSKFGVDGPEPTWRIVPERKALLRETLSVIESMIDEGFTPDNLIVLCESAEMVRKLREEIVGPFSLGRWGSRGIPVESIARFKGMENEAAVIVFDDGCDAVNRTSAYVALSRPRTTLAVVGSPLKRRFLGWH